MEGDVEPGEHSLRIRDGVLVAEVELADQAGAGALQGALLEQRPLGTLDVDLQQIGLTCPDLGEEIGDRDQIDVDRVRTGPRLER